MTDFLANENFPLSSIRLLREAGHRVISIVQDAPGSKDEAILNRSHTESLIILTFDRDYGELIYRHQDLPPGMPSEPAEILINIMANTDLSVIGRFTIVERGRVRQRALHTDRA